MLVIRGILAVLFGLAALLWPGLTLIALVFLFGAYVLVDGVTVIVASLQERTTNRQWWVLLLEGIIGIIAGVLAFVWPAITALALLYIIASWAIITGIFEIVGAFSERFTGTPKWLMGISGVISLLLGVLLAILPGVGLLSLVWLIGIYALVFGILFIIHALQRRPLAGAA
jgi:uncharacterized membrane protein HdeD (DUF308 family)